MGRAEKRSGIDIPNRLRLVEDDLDKHDATFAELRDELAKIKGILIGILVSVTTAALLLAINLAVPGVR